MTILAFFMYTGPILVSTHWCHSNVWIDSLLYIKSNETFFEQYTHTLVLILRYVNYMQGWFWKKLLVAFINEIIRICVKRSEPCYDILTTNIVYKFGYIYQMIFSKNQWVIITVKAWVTSQCIEYIHIHSYLFIYFSQRCIPPWIHLVRRILCYAGVTQYWSTLSASNAPSLLWYIKVWMKWEYTDQAISLYIYNW